MVIRRHGNTADRSQARKIRARQSLRATGAHRYHPDQSRNTQHRAHEKSQPAHESPNETVTSTSLSAHARAVKPRGQSAETFIDPLRLQGVDLLTINRSKCTLLLFIKRSALWPLPAAKSCRER